MARAGKQERQQAAPVAPPTLEPLHLVHLACLGLGCEAITENEQVQALAAVLMTVPATLAVGAERAPATDTAAGDLVLSRDQSDQTTQQQHADGDDADRVYEHLRLPAGAGCRHRVRGAGLAEHGGLPDRCQFELSVNNVGTIPVLPSMLHQQRQLVGIDPASLLQRLLGVFKAQRVRLRQVQIVACDHRTRLQFDRPSIAGHRLSVLTCGIEQVADVDLRLGHRGIESQRATILVERLFEVATVLVQTC